MPLKLSCDWCLKEETPKVRFPLGQVLLPKGWDAIPVEPEKNPTEVILACGRVCKTQLQDARMRIREVREEKRKAEEKKGRKLI